MWLQFVYVQRRLQRMLLLLLLGASRPMLRSACNAALINQLPNKIHGHFVTPLQYVISLNR